MKRRSVVFGFIGILSIIIVILFTSYRTRLDVEARTKLEPITAWLPIWEYVVDIGNINLFWDGLWPGYFQNRPYADYIVLQNNRSFPVAMGGWDVRSSSFSGTILCQYVIPSDRTIAPFSEVHIWAGSGQEDGVNLYAGCSFDSWSAWPKCDVPRIITTLGIPMHVENEQPPRWFSRPIFYDPDCPL